MSEIVRKDCSFYKSEYITENVIQSVYILNFMKQISIYGDMVHICPFQEYIQNDPQNIRNDCYLFSCNSSDILKEDVTFFVYNLDWLGGHRIHQHI